MTWRHYVLMVGFVALTTALGLRVGYLGFAEKDFLQEQGDARAVRFAGIRAQRGVVRDRHGEPVAVSTPVYTVWADPSLAQPSSEELLKLSKVLGVQASELGSKVADRSRQYAVLARRMTWEVAQEVRALELDSVHLSTEYQRYYPAGEMAAHVVGITGWDGSGVERGREGIEAAFDPHLQARAGRKSVLRDRRGQIIRDLEYLQSPKYGEDLSLSLDLRLQFVAYRELKSAIEGHGARSGSLVMLDARTGDILALANQPSYNPNEPVTDFALMRNRAVTDAYEPGSTVKPFAVMAALASGEFARDSQIDTAPGYFRVGNKLVQDPSNRGVLDLTGILQTSSQVAVAKMTLALEQRAVYEMLAAAGAGVPVGSGLPGETAGAFSDQGLRSDVVRVTLAYGYGLSLSPLQLARAYLTLANDGQRLDVSILKSHQSESVQVFDPDLSREVVDMMQSVTADGGTATAARVPGFSVAGKTGTARIVGDEGYDDQRHVALFAGIVPADDPRLVVVVVVNEPRAGVSGGGSVAAPVFARVAERSLRLLGVPVRQELLSQLPRVAEAGDA